MRVVGVDPGLSRCGVGVIEGTSARARVVRVGVMRTPPARPTADRLAELYADLGKVLTAVEPDAVAVERVFFNSNVSTGIGVAQAAGVVLLCATQMGLPVAEYSPNEVKAAVAGNGDAAKEQVGYMVRTLLGLAEVPRPADASDALAVAICHLQAVGAAGGASGDSDRSAARVTRPEPGAATGMSRRLAEAVARSSGPGAGVVRRGGRDRVRSPRAAG